jgi:hypothetical protein
MCQKSRTGGVMPKGPDAIQFDLRINGRRIRPSLRWTPTEENLRRAREHLKTLKARIAAGTFRLAEEFPEYVRRHTKQLPLALIFCDEVFDALLAHEEARVARGDLAPSTLEAHRQILNYTWRPELGDRPFLSVRYSQLQHMQMLKPGASWSRDTHR